MITDLVSAVVVLAAFGAGLRWLAARAFGRSAPMPRLRLPGRRGGLLLGTWRVAVRAVVLAARFASGAPLGRRRTDATFLSPGTKAIGGVPGWFTTAEPGRWAYLPGWQRAAARWAAVAVAAGLSARPCGPGRCWAGWPCWPAARWPPASSGGGMSGG